MTAQTYADNWLPIEWSSGVVQRILRESAVEANGSPHTMTAGIRRVLRSGGLTTSTGTTYSDDASALDYKTMTAVKFNARVQVEEDDLHDVESVVDFVNQRASEFAVSYADSFDNACLGVTGTENNTTVPFTSVYKAIRSNDTNADYTADDNYLTWDDDNTSFPTTGGGNSFYEKASETLELVEAGQFWSPSNSLVVASPGFRAIMRLTTDGQGRPIFIQGVAGTPDTLFGVPVAWSRGCKTSNVNTDSPEGNDLLVFVGDKSLLKVGRRSGPETLVDAARAQDDSDNTAIKMRVRRGFVLGNPNGAAVLERTTD